MDSTGMVLMMATMVLLLPIVGFFMAATPYLMRRGEVFAVTVPTSEWGDPYLVKLKRGYAAIVSLVTLALTAIALLFAFMGNGSGALTVTIAGMLVLCAGGYLLMLLYRAKTKAYKKEKGWSAPAREAVAAVGEEQIPRAISLKWNLLYIPVILVTLAIGLAGYPGMPDVIPMHADLAGNVNRWVEKGPGIIAFPLLVQLFLAVCFVFSHWTITRSKKWSEPGAPATSAVAYGMFAHAQSIYLLASGLVIATTIGISFMLSSMDAISLGQASVILMIAVIPIVIGAIAVSVVYGQAGSRVFKRIQGSDTLLVDDDGHWKLGVFYWNPDDPSLFLPERFGVGWTVNLARPVVWFIIVASIVLTVLFIVTVAYLA